MKAKSATFDGKISSLECLSIPEMTQELGSRDVKIVTKNGTLTVVRGETVYRASDGEFSLSPLDEDKDYRSRLDNAIEQLIEEDECDENQR